VTLPPIRPFPGGLCPGGPGGSRRVNSPNRGERPPQAAGLASDSRRSDQPGLRGILSLNKRLEVGLVVDGPGPGRSSLNRVSGCSRRPCPWANRITRDGGG